MIASVKASPRAKCVFMDLTSGKYLNSESLIIKGFNNGKLANDPALYEDYKRMLIEKKCIFSDLIMYYKNHPDLVSARSEIQKKYFEQVFTGRHLRSLAFKGNLEIENFIDSPDQDTLKLDSKKSLIWCLKHYKRVRKWPLLHLSTGGGRSFMPAPGLAMECIKILINNMNKLGDEIP